MIDTHILVGEGLAPPDLVICKMRHYSGGEAVMIYTHKVSDDIPRFAWMIYKAFALMIYTPLA